VGLDVEARHRFIDSIRDYAAAGRTMVLTTHILEEAASSPPGSSSSIAAS
jgi:ABC-type multidrug transport system ATPase subunit